MRERRSCLFLNSLNLILISPLMSRLCYLLSVLPCFRFCRSFTVCCLLFLPCFCFCLGDDVFDTATPTTSETADGGLGDALDIVAKDLAMTLGAPLPRPLPPFSRLDITNYG